MLHFESLKILHEKTYKWIKRQLYVLGFVLCRSKTY